MEKYEALCNSCVLRCGNILDHLQRDDETSLDTIHKTEVIMAKLLAANDKLREVIPDQTLLASMKTFRDVLDFFRQIRRSLHKVERLVRNNNETEDSKDLSDEDMLSEGPFYQHITPPSSFEAIRQFLGFVEDCLGQLALLAELLQPEAVLLNQIRTKTSRKTPSLDVEHKFEYVDEIDGDHIRILTLEPSTSPTADIVCNLQTYSREQCIMYDALSYCCGPEHPTRTITVNGLPMDIRNNLASALCDLRLPDQPRHLWADAICINQVSVPEKSVQVSWMGETYRKCKRAVVWLGRASEEDQGRLAMQSIRYISAQFEGMRLAEVHENKRPLPEMINGAPSKVYLLAIKRFLEQPWFGRLWVVQEVCLSANVDLMWGRETLAFRHLTTMQRAVIAAPNMRLTPANKESEDAYIGFPLHELTPLFDSNTSNTRQLFQVTPAELWNIEAVRLRNCRLLTHMWTFRKRRCSDPKDRIFSLLSISPDVNALILPDYGDDLNQVFAKTTQAIMTKHQNLNVFSLCPAPDQTSEVETRRPSWVPDFDLEPNIVEKPWMAHTLTSDLPHHQFGFQASNNSKIDAEFSKDLKILKLSGYYIDRIHACSIIDRLDGIYRAWSLVQEKIASQPHQEESMQEIFWRTMITNRRLDSSPATNDVEGKEFELWWDTIKKQREFIEEERALPEGVLRPLEPLNSIEALDRTEAWIQREYPRQMDRWRASRGVLKIFGSETNNYDRAWYQHGFGRYLFTTDKGFVGTARPGIRPGDHVCLLAGGQTPFIIRKENENYQLVSETYIHGRGIIKGEHYGIMNGEYWKALENGKMKKADFVLV